MPGPSVATTTNTAIATTSAPVLAPACATVAAAPTVSSRFFGLIPESATPMASDRPAVNPSIVRIHFGGSAASPARGRARHWRAASSRSSAPSTSLSTSTQVAGSPSLAPAPPATSSTIVLTTASPRTHPARNAGPLRRPAGVPSISTTAIIGTGLSDTPTANASTCPIAPATAPNSPPRAGERRSPAPGDRGSPTVPRGCPHEGRAGGYRLAHAIRTDATLGAEDADLPLGARL